MANIKLAKYPQVQQAEQRQDAPICDSTNLWRTGGIMAHQYTKEERRQLCQRRNKGRRRCNTGTGAGSDRTNVGDLLRPIPG